MALKAHNEARQAADLIGDLAQRLKPTDGPFKPGTRVYFWHPPSPLAPHVNKWMRAKVLAHDGAIVTLDCGDCVRKVNQSKVKQDRDEWHDVHLPPALLDPPERTSVAVAPDQRAPEQRPGASGP